MSENVIQRRIDSPAEQDDPGDEELDLDDRFHVLQNERRRRIIRYLTDSDAEMFEMSDIAEEVGARENGTSREALTSQERQRVYIALYQCHLPKLADVGLIDYKQRRGVVETRDELDRVAEHLPDHDPESERTGHDESRKTLAASGVESHLAVTAVGVAFGAAVLFNLLSAQVGLLAVVVASGLVAAAYFFDD